MISAEIIDWLNLLLRFLHVVTAIAWIGASFYFIWLDLSLEAPTEAKRKQGLGGELWAIHGGGIYEVGKYTLEPPAMPANLHWFKWEAYSTWLTGAALMISYYYLRADTQLILPDGPLGGPAAGIVASVAMLLAGLALYESVIRLAPKLPGVVQVVLFTGVVLALSWAAYAVFAPRAAILHVGATLATIMAANVFLGIIPSQKSLVRAIERGEAPDAELALSAKRRSTHNNYLTLPVLVCMLANHSPMLFGHPYAWLLVPAAALITMTARHYFNQRNAGAHRPWLLVAPALAFLLLAGVAARTALPTSTGQPVEAAQVQPLVVAHCTPCHAEQPTQLGFAAPPGGYVFNTVEDLRTHSSAVVTSIASGYMPLGNLSGMTPQERQLMLDWLAGG